jgi:hypothetical protein
MIETNVIFVYEDGTESEPMRAIVTPNPYYFNTSNGFLFDFNEEDNNYVI